MSDSKARAAEIEEEEKHACGCELGQECNTEGVEINAAGTLTVEEELNWLREQYMAMRQENDSLRQAYSTAGQEASALRRKLASRAPTVRERAAVACIGVILGYCYPERSFEALAVQAVKAADALVDELAKARNAGEPPKVT